MNSVVQNFRAYFAWMVILAGLASHTVLAASSPSITTQPQSQSVLNNSNATLSVVASGQTPLFYQWYLNGTNRLTNGPLVSGATTAVLNFTVAAQTAPGASTNGSATLVQGPFKAVVTNSHGSANSSNAFLTILFPAEIILNPSNKSVLVNSNVTMSAGVVGSGSTSFTWYHNGSPVTYGGRISGSALGSLNISNVQTNDAGQYVLAVTNTYGSDISAPATLAVLVPPAITTQPANQVALLGSSAIFSGEGTGTGPLLYQWQRDGTNLVDNGRITGTASPALTISNIQLSDRGGYRLVVSNAAGVAISTEAGLAVGPLIAWGNNIYGQTTIPLSSTNAVAVGAGARHSLALKSDGTAIGWGYDVNGETDVPADLTNVIAIAVGGAHNLALKVGGTVIGWGYNASGQTNVPLGLNNVLSISAGANHSLALRKNGTVVGWGDNSSGQTISPSTLTNAVAIAAGGDHSLALRSDGTVIAWGNNSLGQATPPFGLSNVIAVAAGISHSLALRSDGTVVAWGANYYGERIPPPGLTNVIAIAAGRDRSLAVLSDGTVVGWGQNSFSQTIPPPGISNVLAIAAGDDHTVALEQYPIFAVPPVIVRQPSDCIIPTGETIILNASATGSSPLRFQWYFNSLPIGGETNTWLALTSIQPAQAGGYQLVVTNNFGSATSQVFSVSEIPGISIPPQNGIAFIGSNQTFTATVLGANPLNYQWYMDGTPLTDSARILGSTTTNLTISDVQPSDAGTYSLVVTNASGSNTVEASLVVATQPVSQTVLVGTNVLLLVTADAPNEPAFLWLKNGISLSDNSQISGSSTSFLSISNVQTADSGAYQVVISNSPTVVTSAVATLTVLVPPTITTQPKGRSSPLGLPQTFSAAASGTAPLSYQWILNGTNLPGATNANYTNSFITINDLGAYQLVVTNAGGAATSAVAMLTLGPVVGWGNNGSGQSMPPSGLSNVVAIAASSSFSLALKGDGTVVAWGSTSGTNVPLNLTNAVAIAAGNTFGVAVRSDGTLVTWGTGSGTNGAGSISNVVLVSSGTSHSLGLRTERTLAEWGVSQGKTPIPAGLTKVVSMSDGAGFAVAARADGSVVAWGSLSAAGFISPTPPVTLSNVVSVAAGSSHALALKSDGTVFPWGLLGAGGAITNMPAGLNNVTAIAAASAVDQSSPYSLALRSNGTVVAWGQNTPVGGLAATNVPPGLSNVIAIAAGSSYALALVSDGSPVILREPVGGTAFSGNQFTLAATVRGQLPLTYSWSSNGVTIPNATNSTFVISNVVNSAVYQLVASNALGVATSVPAPITVLDAAPAFLTFPPSTNRPYIGSVFNLGAALIGSGPLAVRWQLDGQDIPGQTNSDLTFSRVRSTNGGSYTLIASNGFNVITSSVARVFPVSVVGWGTTIYGTTNIPLTLTNAIAVGINFETAEALRSDGTVTNWGFISSTPPDVTNIVEVAPGNTFGIALRANGTVKTWSIPGAFSNAVNGLSNIVSIESDNGQAATFLRPDGTILRILSSGATNLFPQLSNVVALTKFNDGFAALRADGTIFASGTGTLPPASANSNVVDVAMDRSYGVVLKRDRSIQFWGGFFLGSTNVSNVLSICANAAVRSNGTVSAWTWTPNNPQLTNAPSGLANIGVLDGTANATMALMLPRDPASGLLPDVLNTSALVVSSRGSPQWFGQTTITHDGTNAAQSADIGNNTASSMRMWVAGPVNVSFWWKVSSETNHDFLSFSAGGVVLTNISGETGWRQSTVSTPPGNQILQWTYSKDGSGAAGQDAGWVDQLVITPIGPSITTQPSSKDVIGGSNATFVVIATGTPPLAYQWLNGTNPISGMNGSAMTLFNVTRTNSGVYAVLVTNIVGSITSSNAVLKVHVPQLLTAPVLQPGGSLVFNSSDIDGGLLSPSDLANLQVQVSSNLIDWDSLPGSLTLTNGMLQLQDPITNAPSRFYRIVESW